METELAGADLGKMFPRAVTLESGLGVRRVRVGNYRLDFFQGDGRLAVAFAAEPKAGDAKSGEDGWNLEFLSGRGCSVLTVTPENFDWYRGPKLHEWFRSEVVKQWLGGFDLRLFIGRSAGGFAAVSFSRVVPDSLVLAFNPQSTLNRELVKWETRFAQGRGQDWDGDFADAAPAVKTARRVFITYDPFHRDDRRHVARLAGANVLALRLPFLGHDTREVLRQLKILPMIVDYVLDETLTGEIFGKLSRNRRMLPRYHENALRLVRKAKFRDAILFDAVKKHQRDTELYHQALTRFFEKRADKKYLELYYGRLSLSEALSGPVQGVLRANTGVVCQRNDPGKFEPALRKERRLRIAALKAAIDFESVNLQELMASARFMNQVRDWEKAVRLLAAVQPKYVEATRVLTRVEKIKKKLADWW